jgi:hypothetical protein
MLEMTIIDFKIECITHLIKAILLVIYLTSILRFEFEL